MKKKGGGRPSFKNYKTPDDKISYPASLCVSINEEVVHGIPSERVFKDGDIVSLDLGIEYKGFYTDSAITVSVGNISEQAKKLIETTQEALNLGIMAVKNGAFIGNIGYAIQSFVEKNGFNVVRKLVGHGLGRKVHEPPEIPNFGVKGKGEILREGEVIAIEPIKTAGRHDIYLDKDQSALIRKKGAWVATSNAKHFVAQGLTEIITKI